MGLHIANAAKLRDVAPRFISEAGRPETFAGLQAEILEAANDAQGSWVSTPIPSAFTKSLSLPEVGRALTSVGSILAFGAEALLGPEVVLTLGSDEVPGVSSTGQTQDSSRTANHTSTMERTSSKESELSLPVHSQSQASLVTQAGSTISGSMTGQATGLGSVAALDEKGYSAVVLLKSNNEMQTFLRRTVEDLGLKVVREEGLTSMVPAFSGQISSSSFGAFKGKALNMLGMPGAWLIDPLQPSPPAAT